MNLALRHPAAVLRSMLLAASIVLGLANAVLADPFEDAEKALARGDYAAALKLLHPLAEADHTTSQAQLGILYEFGRGTPQNYAEAMKWYRLAAAKGFGGAQINLGV
ncbi:MAG: sel1 repeat family protein, partial [Hyphomicrobiales bacterium]